MADPSRTFGDAAARYAAIRPDYPAEIFAFMLERLKGPRRRAVDLGAGSGQASRPLAAHFDEVTAVEPDARMLGHLDEPDIRKINLSAEEADFPAGSIDVVIAATSFHWMEQDLICSNVARWLRPGGVFFPFLYGPFIVEGAARVVYERHRALWMPFMDRRLGPKADYARAIRQAGAFEKIETYSSQSARRLAPQEAAELFCTTSYTRAYAAHLDEEAYVGRLARELAAAADDVNVKMPLGGVLAVRR